jgi:hypothetical protein
MRLVKVSAPEGMGEKVAQLAFESGIDQVSLHRQDTLKPDGTRTGKDVIDIQTSTPAAKKFIEALMAAPFYDPGQYSLNVRQPRSIASRGGPSKVTWPLVEPSLDIYEDLWQFSHLTLGFVGRVLIAGLLLAYGVIEDRTLVIVAGLLFLPLLPLKLAVGFGCSTREWRLAAQVCFAKTPSGLYFQYFHQAVRRSYR